MQNRKKFKRTLGLVGLVVTKFYFLTIVISSCKQNQAFDRLKWCEMSSVEDNTRNSMLNDVLCNHLIKGKNINDVKYLICGEGTIEQQSENKTTFVINIVTKYSGLEPIFTKDLYVYLNKDSIITNIKVYENHTH